MNKLEQLKEQYEFQQKEYLYNCLKEFFNLSQSVLNYTNSKPFGLCFYQMKSIEIDLPNDFGKPSDEINLIFHCTIYDNTQGFKNYDLRISDMRDIDSEFSDITKPYPEEIKAPIKEIVQYFVGQREGNKENLEIRRLLKPMLEKRNKELRWPDGFFEIDRVKFEEKIKDILGDIWFERYKIESEKDYLENTLSLNNTQSHLKDKIVNQRNEDNTTNNHHLKI